jgi:hypothetical protein
LDKSRSEKTLIADDFLVPAMNYRHSSTAQPGPDSNGISIGRVSGDCYR